MVVHLFQRRRFYDADILRLDHEIRSLDREIRHLESELARLKRPSAPPLPLEAARTADSEARRRFASYLSTGSFQTIPGYKFKSDFIRRKRLLWGSMIVIALGIVYLLLKLL